ncbi:uncharacterized protein LOC143448579 [Clavelina lepadiformis]|uniref:uncharacterized protein LOC143448579 n=1 Tax=Clavelina lepadiformis TaxID=159417 RepID=UPI0040422A0C
MECDPGIIQVDVLLKAISDLISQELKSLRQEMKMEFAQLQVNIEDMVLKILAETKKTETMNNAIPIEEISQPLHVESDISLKIEDVYSEKAPDFPLVEAIKEEPLLFEEYEVSQPEIDDLNISMLDKIPSQSNIGVNATVKIVKPQSCVARNSDEKFSDSITQVFVGKNKEKHFCCNFCDRSLKCKRNLKVHIRTHTGERPYQCQVCHKSFSVSSNLKTHMRTHTGDQPYQCDVCHKSFTQSSSLKAHLRTHTGERPYQCGVCHKSFTFSNQLKIHMTTHDAEQPYECNMCHKSFSASSSLKVHIRTHTGERLYQCQVCRKSFTQSSQLKTHMRIHTGEQPYQCQVCHKSFSQMSNLRNHETIHTGKRP